MAHPPAKLTPFGRLLLVQRVTDLGWSVAAAAEAVGVSRATAEHLTLPLRDGRARWPRGLVRPPHRSPHALDARTIRRIPSLRPGQAPQARTRLRHGPHRLAARLGHPRSTSSAVLRRHGCSRPAALDRSTEVPVRYVRERPGELPHLDVQQLARIPDGGGHRLLGREVGRQRQRGAGSDEVHVAVDDASRLASVQVLPDQRGDTAARFLLDAARCFADHGVRIERVRIERVLTDRAFASTQARAFATAVQVLGARHKLTRPSRPQTNGKAERFIRTLLAAWAEARLSGTDAGRPAALPGWLAFYNHRRPHTALGGRPPITVVNKVHGNYT